MASKNGNRANVMNRWYGREKYALQHQTPRAAFKGEAQYTFEKLFITPFTHVFTADDMGRTGYTPIKRSLTPTGIHVVDAYLQALHSGQSDVADFCARYNARTSDLDGLVFLLTGMTNQEFRNRWILKTADLLLRYTDMSIEEVARRSGAGTRTNLYYIFERELNTSPTARRRATCQPGECGRYKIVEKQAE